MKNKHHQDSVRKLARSFKYQHLYSAAQNLSSVYLFENLSDFSRIQLEFLYWITLYNRLYQDLAMGEKYLTEEVIDDDFLCDCYLIWEEKIKRKRELEKIKNPDSSKKSENKRQIDHGSTIPSVIFRKG